jgi:transposase
VMTRSSVWRAALPRGRGVITFWPGRSLAGAGPLYHLHPSSTPGVEPKGRDPGEDRRPLALEERSSNWRLASSTGVQGSNGIQRPRKGPRMYKGEHGHRLRGSRPPPAGGGQLRYFGIDIASETHVVAAVDEKCEVLVRPTSFGEDAEGYERLRSALGPTEGVLVALEATGHYWQNLVATLVADGYAVVLINPLRTHRYAEEDLERAKTDVIDAHRIAKMACEKRLGPTVLPDAATLELRELVRYRQQLQQELGDKVRRLHRLVDLGFPEFRRHVRTLDSELASAILREYPTAEAFKSASRKELARLRYDGKHKVGDKLAGALLTEAKASVGRHHGPAYQTQVRNVCDDLDTLRRRLKEIDKDITATIDKHEIGRLLITIEGVGPTTAANLLAELGDISRFRDASALAAYVGVVPGIKESGKNRPKRAGLSPLGNARLRRALWMPTLAAVRRNPWLKAYYERLCANGKRRKVALVAAMRKLLHAVYSVVKNRRAFVPLLPPGPLPPQQ